MGARDRGVCARDFRGEWLLTQFVGLKLQFWDPVRISDRDRPRERLDFRKLTDPAESLRDNRSVGGNLELLEVMNELRWSWRDNAQGKARPAHDKELGDLEHSAMRHIR